MTCRQTIVLFLTLASVTLALLAFETAGAAPPALAPTEGPTKRPYVFPTPIFMPTYPGDVPVATTAPPRTPVVPPAGASPKPAGSDSYTVLPNDNPWTIAQKLCGSGAKWSSIVRENNIADSTRLRIGTVLKIPADCSGGATIQPTTAAPAATALPTPTPNLISFSIPVSTPVSSPRTPTPSTFGGEANTLWQVGMMLVNVGSGLLLLGSVLSGLSAWLVHRRVRFVYEMTHRVRRLRVQHKKPHLAR